MSTRIDPFFGHWFAGFVAGEGSFTIFQNKGSWECVFTLRLRDDDTDILHEITNHLGIGRCYGVKARGTSNPQTDWRVASLDECLQLIHVLDQFSLRAKKAKDYHIWRRAVFAKSAKDFDRLESLAAELKDGRTYKPPLSAM